jgi:hypothetical protein
MEPPPPRPQRPALPTIAAVVMMLILCGFFVYSSYDFFRDAGRARIQDPYGYYEGRSFFLRFMGVLTLAITAFIGTCALGILRLRPWARDAAMYTFCVFAVMTGLSFLAAPAGDAGPGFWILAPTIFGLQVGVIVLLNSRKTREEFYAIEDLEMGTRRERRRLAYERDALRRKMRRERRLAGSADVVLLPTPDERKRGSGGSDGMGA